MDIRTLIDKAGGNSNVVRACRARGIRITSNQISNWKQRNAFPASEWTGKTCVAGVICELIRAIHNEDIHPLDLCPGAGQYMQRPEDKAA